MDHAERESIKDAIWLGAGFALIFALACLIGYELGVQHERRAAAAVGAGVWSAGEFHYVPPVPPGQTPIPR